MLERTIERALVKHIEAAGGKAYKFVSPGTDGMPDRIIILPGGKVSFIELKAPGQKPRPLQVRRHQQLHDLGITVHILDNTDHIDKVIHAIQAT